MGEKPRPETRNPYVHKEPSKLVVTNWENPYNEIANALFPHRSKPERSVEFRVEERGRNSVSIAYPGKKVIKPPSPRAVWRNLYDFVVIPRIGEKQVEAQFTFKAMLDDFVLHKKASEKFWDRLTETYDKNLLSREPPALGGIDSWLYLSTLKWMWIQEDLNYKLSWQDVGSEVRYVQESKGGSSTKGGAGRAKFYAALILLKYHSQKFSASEVKKIIPMY